MATYKYSYHEERGEFHGYVEDRNGRVVWEVNYPDYYEDVQTGELIETSTIFHDGFLAGVDDVEGLEDYLKSLHILKAGDELIADNDEYALGGDINTYKAVFYTDKGGEIIETKNYKKHPTNLTITRDAKKLKSRLIVLYKNDEVEGYWDYYDGRYGWRWGFGMGKTYGIFKEKFARGGALDEKTKREIYEEYLKLKDQNPKTYFKDLLEFVNSKGIRLNYEKLFKLVNTISTKEKSKASRKVEDKTKSEFKKVRTLKEAENDPRVENVYSEYGNIDSDKYDWWIELKDGWICKSMGSGTIHEQTLREVLDLLNNDVVRESEYARGGRTPEYETYHETLASVLDEAEDYITKKGYRFTDDSYFPDVTNGGIPYGVTQRVTRDVEEVDGKHRQNTLILTIYRMDSGRYELVMHLARTKYASGGQIHQGDKVIFRGKEYIVTKITNENVAGFIDTKWYLDSNKIGETPLVLDTPKEIIKMAEGGETESNFMKTLKDEISDIFPESYVQVNVKRFLDEPSVYILFLLGKDKDEWKNQIYNNDDAMQSIIVNNVDDKGNPKGILDVHSSTAGRITITSTNRMYAFESIKVGWRNFKADEKQSINRIVKYFEKLKQILIDNFDKLTPYTQNLMIQKNYIKK